MDKKLPSVFANRIEKELGNNDHVFYSERKMVKHEENDSEISSKKEKNSQIVPKREKNIQQKINEILHAGDYVYKADVEITTKTGTQIKRIVGKNSNNLITFDNELIPLSEIVDIQKK